MAKGKPKVNATIDYSKTIKSGTSAVSKVAKQTVTDLRAQNKQLINKLRGTTGEERKQIQRMINQNNKMIKKTMNQMYRTNKRGTKATRQIAQTEADTKKFAYASMAEGATSAVGGATGTGIAAINRQTPKTDLVDVGSKSEVSSGRDEEENGDNTSIADLINSLGGKYD